MKIRSILISNFRGIQNLEATDLGDTIIIAGQNGSGKSCIFDAIRLLKTTYGGYFQNEWQNFFGEFQIQLHGSAKNLHGLFYDRTIPIVIDCRFQLRDEEKKYVTANARDLLEEYIWRTILPEAFQFGGHGKAFFANQLREKQPEVQKRIDNESVEFLRDIAQQEHIGRIEILPTGQINTYESKVLSVIFSNFRPNDIGVIDFHGAQRHYGRELVQGINLSLDQGNQAYSQHALYNYNNKYNNVKSEMAGNFVRVLLAEKAKASGHEAVGAGGGLGDPARLTATLQELFSSFFPDKKFLGPRPTKEGSLEFPVRTINGQEHDLDELSSGEKEILYGYLRIRSSAPRNSIILLDEPELHLNPRLIRGLPEFYRRHLGEALQNQLWLVTHSDALIREAIGKPGFNVFHMVPAGSLDSDQSQLRPLMVSGDIEAVLADLVGDLAAYRPGGKALIFEGGGDSDFDKNFVSKLFPDELQGINLISGTNKERVRVLHDVLDRAHKNGDLPTKFYAVVDRDSSHDSDQSAAVNRFVWDVYHIENYLLDFSMIAHVVNAMGIGRKYTAHDVENKLQKSARDVVDGIVINNLISFANKKIVGSINLGFDPKNSNASRYLSESIIRSVDRLSKVVSTDLSLDSIEKKEAEFRSDIEHSFADGTWISKLPGREILRRFVSQESLHLPYETFRNLILSRMAEKGVKPKGVAAIVDAITKD